MKKINKKDNKIGLISLEFSVEAYQSNSNRTIEKLFNEVFTLDIDENKKKEHILLKKMKLIEINTLILATTFFIEIVDLEQGTKTQ